MRPTRGGWEIQVILSWCFFVKAPSSWAGLFDSVELPPGAKKLGCEVELGVVIGLRAKRVVLEEAMSFVQGYLVLCDYSEWSWQKERGGQFNKGKSRWRLSLWAGDSSGG